MGIITGDIKRSLGFSSFDIGEGENKINIDLSKTTKKDIVDFIELPAKSFKGKDVNNLKPEDSLKLADNMREYFKQYFTDKDPSYAEGDKKDEIELFIVKNIEILQKEFTIGFGIKNRKDYEKDTVDAKESILKKG